MVDFLYLLVLPRALLDVMKLLGKAWVLVLPLIVTHVSHAFTSLALKSVGGLDSRGPLLGLSTRIHAR